MREDCSARPGDFGIQDFILVHAPQDDVVRAVAKGLEDTDAPRPGFNPARPPFWVRLLMRLLGRGPELERAEALASLHARASEQGFEPPSVHKIIQGAEAAGPPLTRSAPALGTRKEQDEQGFDDIRISTVAGGHVLVEFRDLASGFSPMAFDLSARLPGTDVLYFRRSGEAVDAAQFDFHVWRNGEARRRVLRHATRSDDDPGQVWWEGSIDGPQTPYEPAGLYDGRTEADLLTDARLNAILGTLGLTTEALFGTDGRATPVLLSRRPSP